MVIRTVRFGTVVGWNGFKFPDGGASDKQLIVLGNKTGQNLIAVLTTSQPHGRKAVRGFANGCFCVLAGGQEGFSKDTWIELYRPQEIERATFDVEMEKIASQRDVWPERDLPAQFANELRNCLKQTDISDHHKSLLE